MNYFLVLHNHPPTIIHEEDRKGYYEALEAWDIRQDLEPLLIFLRKQTVKTWEKQIMRADIRKYKKECQSSEKGVYFLIYSPEFSGLFYIIGKTLLL